MTVIAFGVLSFLLLYAFFASYNEKTNRENMVRDRGDTRVQSSQLLTHRSMEAEKQMPIEPTTYSGLLVDAACEDRSPQALREPPEPMRDKLPAQAPGQVLAAPREGGSTAFGITVDAATLGAEHADINQHLEPDVLSRQSDPSCAITGNTKAYALLMQNGRLLNLDEGGNTLATAAVNADPQGLAMLNGTAPGLKPEVAIKGYPDADRLIVDRFLAFGNHPTT